MNVEQSSAGNGDERSTFDRRHSFRRPFQKWFFSTDRRYQMFQTIVGTTIGNLLAAAIIAGVALASGNLSVSFSWSWRFFWESLRITAGVGLLLGIIITIAGRLEPDEGGSKTGWWSAVGVGLFAAIANAFFWAFVVTFFGALSFSIVHTKTYRG